jgi:hypothetical protein
MTTISTPEGIEYFHLLQLRGCLKMEARGMSHSRLGKIRKPVAIMLGLKPNTKIEQVIEALQAKLDKMAGDKMPLKEVSTALAA